MPNPTPERSAPKLLTDLKAARLLERASELELARTSGTRIAELRAAAAEAGISHESFDAALAELDAEASSTVATAPARRAVPWRRVTLVGGLIAIILTGLAALSAATYIFPNAVSKLGPPVEQETFPLGCISSGVAASLVRPILFLPENSIVASPGNAPRVLTVVGTKEQIRQVRVKLAEHDVAGTKECPVAPAQ